MLTLRLGAYKLPAAELVLVQTLFRLYAQRENFRWTFVSQPPYDAVLVDGTSDEALPPEVMPGHCPVLRLTRINAAAAPNTLARPIRADRLEAWLKATEHDLLDTRPADLDTQRDAGPAFGQAEASEAAGLVPTVRFTLLRWPPAALLARDPQRIRMATLLSRRAFSASELAAFTQLPLAVCQAFLHTLQTNGIVRQYSHPAAAPAAVTATEPGKAAAIGGTQVMGASRAAAGAAPKVPQPGPARPPAAAVSAPPSFARSLIQGIRRRLGL